MGKSGIGFFQRERGLQNTEVNPFLRLSQVTSANLSTFTSSRRAKFTASLIARTFFSRIFFETNFSLLWCSEKLNLWPQHDASK